jgi:hypothetical protein
MAQGKKIKGAFMFFPQRGMARKIETPLYFSEPVIVDVIEHGVILSCGRGKFSGSMETEICSFFLCLPNLRPRTALHDLG